MAQRLSIEEVKEVELDILRYIDITLKNYNIEYWLDGGTLLGCIRHKGYIPWDDDIDLIIRRKDYDRALEILNANSDRYKVMSMYNTDNYYYPFAKVIDTKTRIIEKGIRDIENIGIFVDLFPLDALPSDEGDRKKFYDKIFQLRSVAYYALFTKPQLKSANIVKKAKHIFGKCYGWKRAITRVDLLCRESSERNTEYVVDIVAAWHKNREVKAEAFSETIIGEFEGAQYPIPIGYHEYLSALYGNYMELPPAEERVLKHDFYAYKV